MKILYVSDALSVHTRRFAEYYSNRGYEVHVASFIKAEIKGVHVHVLPTFGLGKLGYFLSILRLKKLYKNIRPDVVHAQYITSYGLIASLANLHPLIITAWGTDILITPKESWLMRCFTSKALRTADQVTTVAEHMNSTVSKLGVQNNKICTIPFGVDVNKFVLPLVERTPPPPLRIISTRNLAPIYDIETIINSVVNLNSSGVDVILDIVGDGQDRQNLESLVGSHGLNNKIIFHGAVNHNRLIEMLSEAHLFITAAKSDGNNISLNEAMACGCYPIATEIAANMQWISDGINGLLFKAGNSDELTKCIQRIITNDSLRINVIGVNRRVVEERANWFDCVNKMENIYKQMSQNRNQCM